MCETLTEEKPRVPRFNLSFLFVYNPAILRYCKSNSAKLVAYIAKKANKAGR